MSFPVRRRVEPGIYERLSPAAERLGLEIFYKDADGKPRRRSVKGTTIHDARDELARARVRRSRNEFEPADPRITFDAIASRFEEAHVAGLRRSSQLVYHAALVLGLTSRRIGRDEITFYEQLARSGKLAPLKTRQSRRTVEITRSLAAELRLAGGGDRVFSRLNHTDIRRQ